MTDELLHPPAKSKRDTPRVDAVRAFVFLSGLKWMEQKGLAEKFKELLPEYLRDLITTMTTNDWVPLDQALDAYAACDALGLSQDDQIDLGRFVSNANNGLVVQTISRLIGKLGGTPWIAFSHADKVWQRSNRGGAIAVYKVGEKIARMEFWQCPLARSPFFVTSMRGAIAIGAEPFAERVVISEIPEMTTEEGFALRIMW
jgi:hypothetical protein